MAIGILVLFFIGISVVSGLGLAFLYLVKNEQVKKVLFYVLAAWGMLISIVSATSLPSNWIGSQMVAWLFGVLSIAGIIVHVKADSPKKYLAARLLVTASIVLGIAKMFLL
ncbi:MAG: hypothetical protein ACOX60_11760 [Massiliimalia sp.]